MFSEAQVILIEAIFGQNAKYCMILLLSSECCMTPVVDSELSLSILEYLGELEAKAARLVISGQ